MSRSCSKCHCKSCCYRKHKVYHRKSGGNNLLVLGLLALLAVKGLNGPENKNINVINVNNDHDDDENAEYDD